MSLIAYADGADSPRTAPWVLPGAGPDPAVLLGWTPEGAPWLSSPDLTGWTVMAGYAVAPAVASGRLRYLPLRLSAVPRLLAGTLVPDVAVVTGVRRGPDLVFADSVGWGPAAALAAASVIVEVDEDGEDLGGPAIPGRVVSTVARPPGPRPRPGRPPSPAERQVAEHVASLLPKGATIQMGPGAMADAIVGAVASPVRVASGLVGDSLVDLDRRGMLDGVAEAGYIWGGRPLRQMARDGRLKLHPVGYTHDIGRLSAMERFVACNTAVQVGLDGSVNVEMSGGRRIAGIGGHADFCAGAARSPGGLSVIAVASTTRTGASTIVAAVEVVSTPRCDVDVVVTEHGVADLRGCGDDERAARLIAVADPAHRRDLASARPGGGPGAAIGGT